MIAASPTVAIVDDQPELRKALGRLLRLNDCDVVSFESGEEFLRHRDSESIDCVLLDLHLDGRIDGFQVLDTLRFRRFQPAVIVMTGHDQPGYRQETARLGASAYLLKPIDETHLTDAIRRAVSGSRPVSEDAG